MDLGKLTAIITAQVDEFERNMDRASGKLDTMGEAGKRGGDKASVAMQNMTNSAKVAAKAITAVALAMASATAVIVKNSMENTRELINQSKAANTMVEAFQRGAFAARSVGVEQEKYADILKDMTDRVGDFISTGAGPMADFFENIAPKVGVTADEFRSLSGQDALQLYVKSLEDANLSQAEMTFYMEAIASDSTRLLPLLKNNAQAMKDMGNRANDLGFVLNDIDINKIETANSAMTSMRSVITGLATRIAEQFAPVLVYVSERFQTMAIDTNGFAQTINNVFGFVVRVGVKVADVMKLIHETVLGGNASFWALSLTVAEVSSAVVTSIDNMVRGIFGGVNALIEFQNEFPSLAKLFGFKLPKIPVDYNNDLISSMDEMEEAIRQRFGDAMITFYELLEQEDPSVAFDTFFAEWDKAIGEFSDKAEGFTVQDVNDSNLDPDIDYESELDSLREFLMDEQELMGKRFADRKALLDEALANEKISKQEHDEMMKGLEEQYQGELTDIQKKAQEERNQLMLNAGTMMANNLISIYSNLVDATEKEGKRNFQLQKAASIAQAVVDGISAGISSYKAGAAIGGPVVGAAFAATSAAATGAMIAKLASASYGGGPSSANVPAPSTPAVQSQQTLLVQGDFDSSQLFSGSAVRDLIDKIGQAQKDGYTVVMA